VPEVCGVFVPESDWREMLSALASYTRLLDPSEYSVESYVDFLLNERVLNVLHNIDAHIEGILKYVRDEYKDMVGKTLLHLSRNIDKLTGLFNNPPKDIRRILLNHIFYSYINYNEDYKHIVKYIPLYGKYETSSGNKIYGVLVYPDENMVKQIKYVIDEDEDESSLYESIKYLVGKLVKFDVENRSIKIGSEEYAVPLNGFVSLIANYKLTQSEHKRVINEIVNELKPELSRFGNIMVEESKITINLDNVAKEINEKHGLNIGGFTAKIKLSPGDNIRVTFDAYLEVKGYRIYIPHTLIEEYCKKGYCDNEYSGGSIFETDNIYMIPRIILKAAEYIVNTSKAIRELCEQFIEVGEKYGYIIFTNMTGTEIEASKSEIKNIEKQVFLDLKDRDLTVSVEVKSPSEKARIPLYYRIQRELLRYEIHSESNYILLGSWFKYRDRGDIENAFKTSEEIGDKVKSIYNKINVKEDIEYPTEFYVALYLLHKANVEINKVSVSQIVVPYMNDIREKIKELTSSVPDDTDKILPKTSYNTIYKLLKLGYIKLGENRTVYINNKRYTDILKEYIDYLTPEEIEEIEKEVVFPIFFAVKIVSEMSDKSVIETLKELNQVDEKIVAPFIKYIRARDLATPVDNTPYWYKLSKDTQKKYIDELLDNYKELEEIYFDEKLRSIFSDYLNIIEETLFKTNRANTMTRIAVEKYTNQLNIPENARIIKTKRSFMVKIGEYLIQVLDINKEKSRFIIYHPKDKEGFIIEAPTVTEAIEDFKIKYSRIKHSLNALYKILHRQDRYELKTRTQVGDEELYTFYYIYDKETDTILPINEETEELVRKEAIKEKHNEEIPATS